LEQTPARESLSSAEFKRLNGEMKQLVNTLKISAYMIETGSSLGGSSSCAGLSVTVRPAR
jgi:hypothetical protein